MIRTMEDLAVVVLDQCITSNGKKIDDEEFEVSKSRDLKILMFSFVFV